MIDKVWTYERIDWDLLRDDLDSAADISPTCSWLTRDEAKAMAETDYLADFEDEEHPDNADQDEPVKMPWEPEGEDNLVAHVNGGEYGSGVMYRVFPIEIVRPA